MKPKSLLRIATWLTALLLPVTAMMAQVSPVSGRVTDPSGSPVAGAFVIAEGTNASTMTDSNGNFSLSVPAKAPALIFQMMGMEDVRVPLLGSQARYEVRMNESQNFLDEAVAIGYGTIIRRELSSSVSSVNSDQLVERASAFNVTQALAGKVAGYTVYNTSGRPGGTNTVYVRGKGSVNASSSPLYVVDGVVDVDINLINPNDIESIDVLKDAAATAMYGSKGANGVIIVTTKSGKSGGSEGVVTYTGSVGISSLARTYQEMAGQDYLNVLRQAYAYNGSVFDPYFTTPYEKLFDYEKNADGSYKTDAAGLLIPHPKYNTKWMEEYYQTGLSYDQNLSFAKATERNSVYASVGYKSMDGIIRNTDAKRLTASLNFTSKINDWLDVRFGANYSARNEMRNDIMIDGSIYHVLFDNFAPFIPYQYPDGTYGVNGDHLTMASSYDYNAMLDKAVHRQKDQQMVLNAAADVKLFPGLTLTLKGDYQTNFYTFGQSAPGGIEGATISNNGFANVSNSDTHRWANEDYLTYDKTFGNLKTTSVLGTSFYYLRSESSYGGATDFSDNQFEYYKMSAGTVFDNPSSGYNKQTMHSVYFRTNLSWAGKYLLGLTLRADGASNFGDNNKYGFFPSVSAGWIVSEEPWFEPLKGTIDLLKLRASYGTVGNASIPSYRTFDRLNVTGSMIFNNTTEAAATSSEPGNKDLKWETSKQIDLGFDLSLWKGRVNLIADFYRKDTENLLYERQVPNTTGFGSSWDNLGLLRNKGMEITLNTHVIDRRDFKWDLDFIYSQNVTKAVDINGNRIYNSLSPILSEEGAEWNSLWVYKNAGIWQLDEVDEARAYGYKPGDIKIADLHPDGVLDDQDRYIIGRVTPKHEFTLVNTFYWRGLSLMVDLVAKTGFYTYCDRWSTQYLVTDNIHVNSNWAWSPNNQNSLVPANRTTSDPWPMHDMYNDLYAYKGDYLKLRNISLSYDLKRDILKDVRFFRGISVGILAENLAVWTAVPALDPEDSTWGNQIGVVGGTYPRPTTVSGTLKLTF